MEIMMKRFGGSTYFKRGSLVARVSGPWRPGNVWKADVYQVNQDFEEAWKNSKITTRERGMDPTLDNILAAMSFGRSNDIDRSLTIGHSINLGYRFGSKKEAAEAVHQHFQKS